MEKTLSETECLPQPMSKARQTIHKEDSSHDFPNNTHTPGAATLWRATPVKIAKTIIEQSVHVILRQEGHGMHKDLGEIPSNVAGRCRVLLCCNRCFNCFGQPFNAMVEKPPACYRSLSGLSGPECPRECPRKLPRTPPVFGDTLGDTPVAIRGVLNAMATSPDCLGNPWLAQV